MENKQIIIRQATLADHQYAQNISAETASSAKARGTGIGKRTPESICKKMDEGNAVIALSHTGEWIGYIYLEVYGKKEYVSHGGLIVAPKWRRLGIATMMKQKLFEITRKMYPIAKIFGITTALATMKINSKLGLEPVTYSEITTAKRFWNKCKKCVNYNNLKSKDFKLCYCTAMLYDPATHGK